MGPIWCAVDYRHHFVNYGAAKSGKWARRQRGREKPSPTAASLPRKGSIHPQHVFPEPSRPVGPDPAPWDYCQSFVDYGAAK